MVANPASHGDDANAHWIFQLYQTGNFDLALALDCPAGGAAYIYATRLVPDANGAKKRENKHVATQLFDETTPSPVLVPIPFGAGDVDPDTFFSVVCFAYRPLAPDAGWSWRLGVQQNKQVCGLLPASSPHDGQGAVAGGVRDPASGARSFSKKYDVRLMFFDVIAPGAAPAPAPAAAAVAAAPKRPKRAPRRQRGGRG